MKVADLPREMARRDVDTMPIAGWARGLLEHLGVPLAGRTPACVAELLSVWRRTLEPALVEHFSIPELHAMATLLLDAGGRIDPPQGGGVQDRRHAGARPRARSARERDRRPGPTASRR